MKTIQKIVLALLMAAPSFGWAQQETEIQDPNARKKIEAARIGLISERLGLTPEQAERFWPIYHEFSSQRKELVKEFREAQRQTGEDAPDARKQELVDLGLKIKQRELDLERDYAKRLLEVISAQQMLNLRNAEREFQRIILNQLQQRREVQQRKENFRDRNQRLRDRNNN